MTNPTIADNKPKAVDLKQGEEYCFCTCGRSSNQPFCNGSHEGTSFTPIVFTPEKYGAAHLCQCKQTKTPPYCDGSHEEL